MMPANRLVVEVADATGLRIGDVLQLRTEQLQRGQRVTVRESKTGKTRRVYMPAKLRDRMLNQAGARYVFEGRGGIDRHRTRQAVYKDMVQAAQVFKRSGAAPQAASISPHSARKRAAVRAYHRGGVDAARALLNHADNDIAVTLLYALSDVEPPRRQRRAKKRSGGAAARPKQQRTAESGS